MNISEFCIKRPVFSMVISFIIIIFGLVGFMYLHTRFFPIFIPNNIKISANYPGASSQLIESSVTTPLEEAISGVEGVDSMNSTSVEGESDITIVLKSGYDVYQIANKLRNKIAMASDQLPTNIKTPTVEVGKGSSDLMDVGVTSSTLSTQSLRDYLERYVINQIEEQPGIAEVGISGADKYAMRIMLDPKKMAARAIGINDITTAINKSNVELPAGKIKGSSIEYAITAQTALHNSQQFSNVIIKNDHGRMVRLKDVATIALGNDGDLQSSVNIDGVRGVNMTIYNTTNGNPLEAADSVVKLLQHIKQQLPKDMNMRVSFNMADYMHASVNEVYNSIFIAIACVILVIYLFLGNLRSTLIPIVTIPVCLIGSFGLIYLFGFTINVITLIALVLSIGLVVDDAIVMLENIYRHIEKGEKPLQAAIKGSKEITFAVVAMTLTLAAVYAPIGFVQGMGSRVFESFAYTLAGAVILSGFIALTLSPMMCSRLLKNQQPNVTGYAAWLDRSFEKLKMAYSRCLHNVLKVRFSIVVITLAIAIGGFYLLKSIPMGFFPQEDLGFIFVNITQPSGSTLEYANHQIDWATKIIRQNPNVATTTSFANDGDNDFSGVFTTLIPYSQRSNSSFQVANAINDEINQIPGLNAHATSPAFGADMQHGLQFYVMTSGSYNDLYKKIQALLAKLNKYPGITHADTDLKFDHQQYNLHINRELASSVNVDVESIDQTLASLLGGSIIGSFNMDGRDYDIFMQAQAPYLHSLDALSSFMVTNNDGKLVPINNLVHVTPTLTQRSLSHYNRLRAALVYANLAPGYQLGQVMKYLNTELPQALPTDMKYAYTGTAKRIQEGNNDMAFLFLLAIVFIYFILAAQFESFLDPLIILLSVPLSIVSALAALKLMDASLNIYAAIGLVTLIGLIAKHGILITQFANQLQKQGIEMRDALIQASSTRLRPILMTTAAMICGALPLLLSSGASAASRHEIAAVIIAGLFFGTFFSLVLVPVTYSFAARLKRGHSPVE